MVTTMYINSLKRGDSSPRGPFRVRLIREHGGKPCMDLSSCFKILSIDFTLVRQHFIAVYAASPGLVFSPSPVTTP